MMADEDDGPAHSLELHPKRTTSFGQRLRGGKHASAAPGQDLATRIVQERERTKYWARLLLLFPLVPVLLALTTVVFGGVLINVAASDCNADLLTFLQGAVVLSYVLLWFYAYCWMGGKSIRSLRTVRVFYLVYGLLCCIWWGGYGTLQAVTATSSGFESCLSMSPSLYLFSQYEVAVFWICLITAIGFLIKENTVAIRERKLAQWRDTKTAKQQAEERAKEQARSQVLEEAMARARQAEEEQRSKAAREQERLYGDSEGDEPPEYEADALRHGEGEAENQNEDEAADEEEDEEEILFEQDELE